MAVIMAGKTSRGHISQQKDDQGLDIPKSNSNGLQAKQCASTDESNNNRISWSSLFQPSVVKMDSSLSFTDAKYTNGALQVFASQEELEENISYWQHSLVGYFVESGPLF